MSLSLEDRAEIGDLYIRYAYAFDDADGDAWAALFTPDGRFGPPGKDPVIGTEALSAFVHARADEAPGMRHVIANVLVEAVDDGSARGRAYFVCYRLGGDGQFRLRNFGRYEDALARHDGGWRIAEREVVSELDTALVDAAFAMDVTA